MRAACFAYPAAQIKLHFLFNQQPTVFYAQLQPAARFKAQRIARFFRDDDLAAHRKHGVCSFQGVNFVK